MRIDKYLKVSRLIKRRTVAKEVADHEKITINGKVCKPSTEIKVNDIVQIRFGLKLVTFKVLNVNEYVKKNEAELMYEILKEEKIEG
ncbi:MAG: RNA-binding S4 domain-containing protein [Bacilli bacterium]|nr:RNA-binding S4 domain-containing protein [Bacilli bacterium]